MPKRFADHDPLDTKQLKLLSESVWGSDGKMQVTVTPNRTLAQSHSGKVMRTAPLSKMELKRTGLDGRPSEVQAKMREVEHVLVGPAYQKTTIKANENSKRTYEPNFEQDYLRGKGMERAAFAESWRNKERMKHSGSGRGALMKKRKEEEERRKCSGFRKSTVKGSYNA